MVIMFSISTSAFDARSECDQEAHCIRKSPPQKGGNNNVGPVKAMMTAVDTMKARGQCNISPSSTDDWDIQLGSVPVIVATSKCRLPVSAKFSDPV